MIGCEEIDERARTFHAKTPRRPGARERNRIGSEKPDLAGVLGDYEDAYVIAPGIDREHKKAEPLRVVSFGSPGELFPIVEGHFDLPAVQG